LFSRHAVPVDIFRVSQTQRSCILAREESTCWARTLFVVVKQKRRLRALRSRGVESSITRVVIVLFLCNLNGGPTSSMEGKGLSESIAKHRIESNLLKGHFGCSRLVRGTGFSNLCKQKLRDYADSLCTVQSHVQIVRGEAFL
jgi:hypothetical protein